MEGEEQPAAALLCSTGDPCRQPRFKLEVAVRINSRTCGVLKGDTVDMSESGLAAMFRIEVPMDEVVELNFTLPLGPVTIYAIVRQRNAFRYGFQFLGSDGVNEIIRQSCRQLAVEQVLTGEP
ncbi:MAG: PilZ domain-containing protein [Terriglobales bacterium]